MMDFSQLFVNIMYFIAEINTISQARATFVIAVDGKWRFCFYFVLVSMFFFTTMYERILYVTVKAKTTSHCKTPCLICVLY